MKKERDLNEKKNFGIAFITFKRHKEAKELRKFWKRDRKDIVKAYKKESKLL